jgi:hypothetical protein
MYNCTRYIIPESYKHQLRDKKQVPFCISTVMNNWAYFLRQFVVKRFSILMVSVRAPDSLLFTWLSMRKDCQHFGLSYAVRTSIPANSTCKMPRDAAKLGRGRRGDKSFCIALCERSDAPALLGTTYSSCAHLSAMRKLWNSESNFKQWKMCLLFTSIITGRLFAVNM